MKDCKCEEGNGGCAGNEEGVCCGKGNCQDDDKKEPMVCTTDEEKSCESCACCDDEEATPAK